MISGMRLLAFKQAVDARGNDMARRPSNLKKDLTTKIDTLDIFQPRLATCQARGLSMWGVGVRSAGHGEWRLKAGRAGRPMSQARGMAYMVDRLEDATGEDSLRRKFRNAQFVHHATDLGGGHAETGGLQQIRRLT